MEGLLIAEEIERLVPLLPMRRLAWRFLDKYTFVLPLDKGALWLFALPPTPRFSYRTDLPEASTGKFSAFQEILSARANGDLYAVEQPQLDRVVRFSFAATTGFVETPPVTLIVELTGRNCNLILLDDRDRILGALREVHSQVNRYRQVRPGVLYRPPPPYQKIDPRSASESEIRTALAGRKLKHLHKVIDGMGPVFQDILVRKTGLGTEEPLSDEALDRLLPVLAEVVRHPAQATRDVLLLPDLTVLRERERREVLLRRSGEVLSKRRQVLEKRLDDLARAVKAAGESQNIATQADLLLTHQRRIPPKAKKVELDDFEGGVVEIPLDPRLSTAQNAQVLYQRAKKRQQKAEKACQRREELQAELQDVETRLANLDGQSDEQLSRLIGEDTADARASRSHTAGIRYLGPHGFSVLVGRNARENDGLTFKVAKSRDVWLHVQGYQGAHVIIRAEGREVPFETILFAAQLAAGHSKAGKSDNVAVDYTLKKNVWRAKGGGPGAVYFSQQKTVYVTPSRRPKAD
ncbi:MAG: NFACT family protein [Trueperaceae bacterium]|nr:MAG: NFACT family protein [Trueperaceae bacterium]